MTAVSDIIVSWTPNTSPAVAYAQIRSRLVGTTTWTEQAAKADANAGQFRFTANAPNSDVEVQLRYQMVNGSVSPWVDMTTHTSDVIIQYATIAGTPTSLSQVNVTEGGKLGGIQPLATVGAALGTNLTDSTGTKIFSPHDIVTYLGTSADTSAVNGIPATTITSNITANGNSAAAANAALATLNSQTIPAINSAIGQAQFDILTNKALASSNLASAQSTLSAATTTAQTTANQARTDAAQVRTDLVPTITAAQSAANAASASAAQVRTDLVPTISAAQAQANQARTDLASEVSRAQGAEGTITTSVTNLTTTVGQNTSAITSEATQRTNADAALSSRIDTVTTTAGANTAAISTESSTRASADASLASQITTLTSTVSNNTSSISSEATTRASADGTLSSRIDSVTATSNGNTSAIQNEATTRASADSSLSLQISNLTSTVAGNAAAINNEATTRASADSALTNQVSTVSSSLNTLQTNAMAVAFPKDFSQGYGQWGAGPGNGYAAVGFQDLSTKTDWTQSSGNVFIWSQAPDANGNGDGYCYFSPLLPAHFTAQGYGYNDGTYLIPVNAGETWRLSAQTAQYGGGASTHSVYWNIFTKAGGPIGPAADAPPFGKSNNYVVTSDSQWHDIVTDTTIPVNGAYIRANFVANGNNVSGSKTGFGMIRALRIDNVTSAQTTNAQITSEATTRASADTSLANQITTLMSTVAGNTSTIQNNYTTLANADSALGSRIDTVTASTNNNASNISSETTARTTADSALGSRIDSLTTTVNGNTSAITSEATARSTADSALAVRTTAIESTFGSQGGSLDANPNFSVWPDGQTLPTGWSWWYSSSAHQAQRVVNTSPTGGYACRVTCDSSEGGIAQWDGSNSQVNMTAGWYVLEADVTLQSGTWNGAGVTLHGFLNISFATYADSAGDVSATKTGRRLFSMLGYVNSATYHNWHNMDNWGGFGTGTTAKTVDWYRSTIRPASDAEVQAGRASSGVAANAAAITSEATTRANADSSLSNQISTLTSTVNANTSAISNEATTRANADSSLASQISTVSANVASNAASITSEATTRAAADSALSTRTSSVESRTTNGNYVNTNPDFSSWPATQSYPTGWQNWGGDAATYTNAPDPLRGGSTMLKIVVPSGSNSVGIQTLSNVYCYPAWWVVEVRATLESGSWYGAGVYAPTFAFNGNGFNFAYAPDTNGVISATQTGQRAWSAIYNVPTSNGAGYSQLYAMANWGNFGTPTAKTIDFNFVGVRPATDAEIKAQTAFATTIPSTIARIATEETTRSNADSALATQITNLTTAYQSADANLQSNINTEATTRSAADASLASRASTIESSFAASSQSLINNSAFSSWPSASALPIGWNYWQSSNASNITKVVGSFVTNQNAVRMTMVSGQDVGIYQTFYISAGWVVLEASAWLNSGSSWTGAGVYVDGEPRINFVTDPDTNGSVGAGSQGIRRFSKIFQTTNNNTVNVYAMTNWTGFGYGQSNTKQIDWYYCNIRAATDAEIKAQVATVTTLPTTIARIATEEQTRASADSGLATQIQTVTTGYQAGDATIQTNLSNATTSLSNATQAVANRTSNLEAQFAGTASSALQARIATEENTRATNDTALASRSNVLEASIGNYITKNSTFAVNIPWTTAPAYWIVWAQGSGSSMRPDTTVLSDGGQSTHYMYRAASTNVGDYQVLSNVAAQWLVLEADVDQRSGVWQGSGVYIDLGSAGNWRINFGSDADNSGLVNGGNYSTRRRWSKMIFNPSNNASGNLYMMGGWSGFGDTSQTGDTYWHQCSLRPASDGEIKAQKVSDANLIARVTTNEGAISSVQGRTAAYWQTTSVAGNNRAQVTIRADANSGAGVDIVGDVTISGSVVTPNSISAAKLTISNRNVNFPGVTFQVNPSNHNQFIISNGYAQWTDANGNPQQVTLSGGTLTGNANQYYYIAWGEGQTGFYFGTDPSYATRQDYVCLGSWYCGGTSIISNYGGTIIDGNQITTGSVNASAITAGTITTDRLVDKSVTQSFVLISNSSFAGGGFTAASGSSANGGGSTGTGGSTGSGGSGNTGGSYCPEIVTPILMADGSWKRAGDLKVGDLVRTQHETSMEWGNYRVTCASIFTGQLWRARGFYRSTKLHRLWIDRRWQMMRDLGQPDSEGLAVHIMVEDAKTYVTQRTDGSMVLNHNAKIQN